MKKYIYMNGLVGKHQLTISLQNGMGAAQQ